MTSNELRDTVAKAVYNTTHYANPHIVDAVVAALTPLTVKQETEPVRSVTLEDGATFTYRRGAPKPWHWEIDDMIGDASSLAYFNLTADERAACLALCKPVRSVTLSDGMVITYQADDTMPWKYVTKNNRNDKTSRLGHIGMTDDELEECLLLRKPLVEEDTTDVWQTVLDKVAAGWDNGPSTTLDRAEQEIRTLAEEAERWCGRAMKAEEVVRQMCAVLERDNNIE